MASGEDVYVLYGDEAVQKLDRAALDKLAHASEREYAKRPDELPPLVEQWHRRLRGVIEAKQVAAVVAGDQHEVVSISAFHLIGKTDDGRPVYEAGRSVTLDEHRGRGYYKMAMGRVMEEIRRKSPDAVVVRATTQEVVEQNCLKSGFQRIPTIQYVHYRENMSGDKWSPDAVAKADEYKYFELDLTQRPIG
jgi:hypothetical protein